MMMTTGCRSAGRRPAATASPGTAPAGVTFTDVTAASGVRFRHVNGGSGKKYMPETMGSGCALFDADGDGRLDLYFVNSRPLPPATGTATGALYRNNGDGTFTDVTAGSGLDRSIFGMGCAVGDYDNDGRDDLYVTCALEECHLYHNEGGMKFRDVTATAGRGGGAPTHSADGLGDGGRWGTSAAWFDYDRDGRLDLFVCNYLKYDLAHDIVCTNRLGQKSYCTPRHYEGLPMLLYHNEGGGKFRDVSRATGIASATGKGLGVVAWDVDRDGWPDLFVANDTTPNFLFRNVAGPTTNDERRTTNTRRSPDVRHSSFVVRRFEEIGTEAGVAFGENGLARAGMGVDVTPLGPKGERALLVANFTNEPISFFWEEGPSFFTERTFAAGLARPTMLTLGFGAFFFDYDNDGAPDIFIANGHVQDDIHLFQNNLSYAEPHQLFRNQGDVTITGRSSTFVEVGAAAGAPFTVPHVSRGAAYGDWDGDGDLDVVVSNNNTPCELLRNDGGNHLHWLQVRLIGRQSNRDAIGAEVRIMAGDRVLRDLVRGGASYCSASTLRLHFGLGDRVRYDAIEVTWPSGLTERFPGGPADRLLTLTEGSGVGVKK